MWSSSGTPQVSGPRSPGPSRQRQPDAAPPTEVRARETLNQLGGAAFPGKEASGAMGEGGGRGENERSAEHKTGEGPVGRRRERGGCECGGKAGTILDLALNSLQPHNPTSITFFC